MEQCDEKQFSNYLELLSYLGQNFSKLGTVETYINRQNDDDSEYDSDENEEQECQISKHEVEVLKLLLRFCKDDIFLLMYFDCHFTRFWKKQL